MAAACRQSDHMVQVRTAIDCLMAVTDCLMAAGVAEALVLAEVSVGAVAAVAAEADGFGNRFKLAFSCRKDGYYAKR